jgi:eukaryotic-like serine/threonine-protein kinase
VITALERAPQLAKYELLERIGLGGMATVYRARDRRLGREVAVKLIHAHLRENVEVAARFVSEARTVARLRHPNVVEVFDVSDENEPERYLVVELVRGTTLRALLSRHKRLAPELAAAVGLEVAAALAHAHREGIVHRDVKPENVLIDLSSSSSGPSASEQPTERAKIKLTDFGIAKLLDAQGVTSTGQVLGSPAHMAPEQIEGGDVGPRADVFALGVMLYESMVGRLPFDGKNPAQVLRRVLDGAYPPADREQPSVGVRWASVLARALARDAADRYESIEAFASAIRAELAVVGITEPRREIDRFLGDQDAYAKAFEAQIVESLVSSGERARTASDYSLATAQFNRALAYRPGDADLVRRVSHLARRERLLRGARIVGALVVALGAVTGALVWSRHRIASPVPRVATRPPQTPAGAGVSVPAASAAPGAGVTPAREVTEAAPARRHPPVLRDAPRHRPANATRAVVVDVVGPKGGHLMIDGIREDTWFGVQHQLAIGAHTFEFVPADSECCRPSPPITRQIDEGESVESVVLAVAFRDARLRVEHSPPGVLRCRSLFGGDLPVPGALGVPMSRLSATGLCTVAPQDSTQGPLTKEVTLTAGQTTEISWP